MGRPARWQPRERSDVASQRVAGKHRPSPRRAKASPAAARPSGPRSRRLPQAGGGGAGTEGRRYAARAHGSAKAARRRMGGGGVRRGAARVAVPAVVRADGVSAWESLAAIDVLLAFVAASGVLLAIVTAAQRVPAVPIALSALVTFAGASGVAPRAVPPARHPGRRARPRLGALARARGRGSASSAGAALAMRDEDLARRPRRRHPGDPGAAP